MRIKKGETSQPILFSALIGILTVVLIAFLIIANIKINQKRGELAGRIDSLYQEIKTLEETKKKLEAGIGQAQSEIYWEGKVREQGFEKPGEETVVVLPPEEQKQTPIKQKGFFEKILEKLGF